MGIRDSSILCPKCYTFNADESDFCNKCGLPLEEKQDTLSISSKAIPAEESLIFSPGDYFGSRYRIIEEIGRGGMGRVYKAEDLELNITVAIKLIRPRYSASPRFIERFKKEVLSARSISHENVIRIFDFGEERGIKYFSMEYIKGQNLREFMRTSGPLSTKRAIELVRQICYALRAAHNHGIIHRDLKPSNIMIDNNGQAYVMDFGLARSISGLEPKKPKAIEGTPKYMSPEQIRRDELDHRTDIYSLGLILYEMLTGQPAFDADSESEYLEKQVKELPRLPNQINPDIPPYLNGIISKCLEKEEDNRYSEISEILKELAHPAEVTTEIRPRSRKKAMRFLLPAAAVVVITAAALFFLLRGRETPAGPDQFSQRISMAVVFFENNTGDPDLDYLSRNLPNLITYDLLQSRYIRPLTPAHLIEIHDKLDLRDITRYSTEDLKQLAEKGGVANILWGSFYKEGDVLKVNTLLYDTQTWESVGSPEAEGIHESSIVDDLTQKIKQALNLSRETIAQDIDRSVTDILTDSPQALNLYMEGLRFYDERKFVESNQALLKAVEIDPGFAMAYRKISINFDYVRDYKNSRLYLDKAMEFIDQVSEYEKHMLQGYYAQWHVLDITQAIQHYEDLLEIYPDDILGNIQLGSVLRNIGEWDKASLRFNRVLQVDRENVLAHYNTTNIFKVKGFYDRARSHLETNRDVFPPNLFHRQMINLFLNQGEFELGLDEIEKLRSYDPESIDVPYFKGLIHWAADDFPQAEEAFKTLSRFDDKDQQLRALARLAELDIARGLADSAKDRGLEGLGLAREYGLAPHEEQFLLSLAYLGLRMDTLDEALHFASQAFEVASAFNDIDVGGMALVLKGMILLEKQSMAEAEATALQLKEYIEGSGYIKYTRTYHLLQGLLSLKQGNATQSTDYLGMAVASLPHQNSTVQDHVLYLDALARAEEIRDDITAAQDLYRQIGRLTNGKMLWGDMYARSYYRLGIIFQERGMTEEAVQAFEKFLSLWDGADMGRAEQEDARSRLDSLK
ncbi:protein kinase [Acidobacteriota bacterium]